MNTILQKIQLKYKYVIKPLFSPDGDSYFNNIEPGDIAIDCGANIGDITQKMYDKGAIVHAFEPNPYAFQKLEDRFRNNNRVHLYNVGVWDKDTSLKLYFHEKAQEDQVEYSTGSSILAEKENVDSNSFVEVKIIDLIGFIEKLGQKVKILKIDIEGAECEVLEKLIATELYKKIGMTLVETHEIRNINLKSKTDSIRKQIKGLKINNINLNWG